MPKLYAFDVDDTLDLSKGPIPWSDLITLRTEGNIVGLCGNWARALYYKRDWYNVINFVGPMEMTKARFLLQLKDFVDATEFIMVGNDDRDLKKWPNGVSQDGRAAHEAGYRFICEDDFAKGDR